MVRALAGILRLLGVLAIVGTQTAHAWNRTDGTARDVGVGADGSVWVIGTTVVGGFHGIWRRTNDGWVGIPAAAERIAVDPQGDAWFADNAQNIFRFDGTTLVQVNRTARDVGVGANGTVWVIGNNPEAGGYGIYRSVDQAANWTQIPGSAVRISVDPQGNAWVVNNANTIFRFDGSQWVQLPGTAKDVGIGADGAAWAIGTDGGIYRWEGSNWARKSGGAAQIAAGPNGVVWVVNDGGEIEQIRRFRMFMARDALDAYEAWKAGASARRTMYAQSQLQTLFNVGEVPPDFEEITAETILGSLAASGASATAIGLTLSSPTVFKMLFPYAIRVAWRPSAQNLAARAAAMTTRMARNAANTARVAAQAGRVGAAGARTAASISAIALSAGPQIIVTIAIEVLSAAIEQQIDIANAEPKLRASLATATNERVDFGRLMSTADGTAIPPTYLPAFAQAAATARTASLP